MARIDDMLLMAYVDGEVDAATAREVETALVGDPSMASRLAAFRGSAAAARAAFADAMHEDPPERLIRALGGVATPGAVVPFRPRQSRRVIGWAMAASVAALVLGSGGLLYTGQITPPEGLQFASSDRWLDHVAAFYEVYARTKIEEERLLVDFNADDESATNTGHFIVALDVSRFLPLNEFKAEMDRHVRDLRGSKTLPGVDAIRLPGDRRHALRLERLRDGVPLTPALLGKLDELANKLGIAKLAR